MRGLRALQAGQKDRDFRLFVHELIAAPIVISHCCQAWVEVCPHGLENKANVIMDIALAA